MRKLNNLSRSATESNLELVDKYEEVITKLEASVKKYKSDASRLRERLKEGNNLVDAEVLINKVAQVVGDTLVKSEKDSKDSGDIVADVAKAVYDLLIDYTKE